MSDRDGYEHGVPCGIAGAYSSPDDAARFYGELFGWEAEEIGNGHLICAPAQAHRGGDRTARDAVAPEAAIWITHIHVDDAGDAHAEGEHHGRLGPRRRSTPPAAARGRGGGPAGSRLALLQPGELHGAQVVNDRAPGDRPARHKRHDAAGASTARSSAGRRTRSTASRCGDCPASSAASRAARAARRDRRDHVRRRRPPSSDVVLLGPRRRPDGRRAGELGGRVVLRRSTARYARRRAGRPAGRPLPVTTAPGP